MKKITYSLLAALAILLLAYGNVAAQQEAARPEGHAIEVNVTGVNEGDVLLFNQYANSESMWVDSLRFDAKGQVIIKGLEPLAAGMYNLRFGENQSVDFFITDGATQYFSLAYETAKGIASLAVKGSPENEGFAGYVHFINRIQQKANDLQQRMQQHQQQGNTDSTNILGTQLQELNGQVRAEMDQIGQNYPNTTYAFFFQSMREPEAPEPSISPMSANYDSLMRAHYTNFYKTHFFDNVNFSDPRITRLPLLSNLMNAYYRIFPMDTEVIKQQTDFLFEKASVDRAVYEFVVRNRYEFFRTAPYPAIQDVALYVAEKYGVNDAENWIDKAFPFRMEEVVRLGKLNSAGSIATDLNLKDPKGAPTSLHAIKSKYTVLYFFNPGCHSCALVTPILWEVYQQYRERGMQVFAVYVDRTESDWLPYLAEKKYDWFNAWDGDGSENLYQKYDIHAIPTIYLLDSDKLIIGKDITIDQLKEQMRLLLP